MERQHHAPRIDLPAPFARPPLRTRRFGGPVATVVLQVDATVSRIHGLAWLTAQRETRLLARLSELYREGTDAGWDPADFLRARLAIIRPRRAELNALGQAYLEELAPGVIAAAHRIRSAGISVELASEVAVESLFGVATALGVTPAGLRGPSVRFDALGAYAGCVVRQRSEVDPAVRGSIAARTLFVGTRPPDDFVPDDDRVFVPFTGFVTHEGSTVAVAEGVSTFGELASFVTS